MSCAIAIVAASASCGPPTQPSDGSLPVDVADIRADIAAETDVPPPDAPMSRDGGDSSIDGALDADAIDSDAAVEDAINADGDETAPPLDAGDDALDDSPLSSDADTFDGDDGSDATDGDDAIVADDADASTDADDVPSDGSSGVVVRIVAGNLTSGTLQSYSPGHGLRIFAGLHSDVALIQEFNYGANTATDIRAFVDGAFGTTYEYVRGTGAIPNGVASRYPLVASGEWIDPLVSNRTFVWARIDVPGPRDLWAVSLHLLTSDPTTRNNEATSLVSLIASNIPLGDLLVVGGDLNTDVRTEPCIVTLDAAVSTAAPYPADALGNSNTNAPRSRPYDWVLADSDLRTLEVPVIIGANSFSNGLVFDTRVYTPLADVAPALAGDSAATGMQHMAVVRDFRLP